ncbi:MAG TPA: hypothetical protein VLG47_02950 [Candidatus Saccharimonadales bacterium]|nr:hypothetical protein [Candidatus Saccharimonadales bacterium]
MTEQLTITLADAGAAAAEEDERRADRFAEFEDQGYDTIDIVDGSTAEGRAQLDRSMQEAAAWFRQFGLPDVVVLPVPAAVAEECGYEYTPTLKAVVAYDPGLPD